MCVTVGNTCVAVANPANGGYEYEPNGDMAIAVGTVVRVICTVGYHPSSADIVRCNNTAIGDSADWVGTPQTCRKLCLVNRLLTGCPIKALKRNRL